MNKKDNRENSTLESLTDLQVSAEQAEETKAGVTNVGGGGGQGKCQLNDLSMTISSSR